MDIPETKLLGSEIHLYKPQDKYAHSGQQIYTNTQKVMDLVTKSEYSVKTSQQTLPDSSTLYC